MNIEFKCKKEEFKNIDMFLHSQEYDVKPAFDTIFIDVEGDFYLYHVVQEQNNKYYIITAL